MKQNPDLQNSKKQAQYSQDQGIMEQSPDLELPYKVDQKTLNNLSPHEGIMEQSPDLELPYKEGNESSNKGGQK